MGLEHKRELGDRKLTLVLPIHMSVDDNTIEGDAATQGEKVEPKENCDSLLRSIHASLL